MDKMEVRFMPVDFTSTQEGEELKIEGYVNQTEQYSEVLSTYSGQQFIEKIAKGAFRRAIQEAKEIDFLVEHDDGRILSSTRNNSLHLVEDDKGLFMSAVISPTTWGKDYYTLVKDGIIRNFSFGFRALEDSWENRSDGLLERTVTEMELFEVSLVKNPAYTQSYAEARSEEFMTLDETLKRGEEMSKEKKEVEIEETEKIEDATQEEMLSETIRVELEKHFNKILDELKDRQDEKKDEEKEEEDVEEEDVKEDEKRNIEEDEKKEAEDNEDIKSTILGLEMKIEKVHDMLEEFLNDKNREENEDEEEEDKKEAEEDEEEEEKKPANLSKLQETLAGLTEYSD